MNNERRAVPEYSKVERSGLTWSNERNVGPERKPRTPRAPKGWTVVDGRLVAVK